MEVILLQDVEKLGLRGEVVDVARGYARNFLLPRKLAEPASPARVAELEKRATVRTRQEASTFEQARELAGVLERTELRFDVKAGPTGSLFGSVTPTDLADELWKVAKIRVDRRKIDLAEPIKKVGRYSVPVELFTDVTVEVTTLVIPEGGELPEVGESSEPAVEQSEAISDTRAQAPEAAAQVSDTQEEATAEETEPSP
jgi:large subunit ribosomal protein L9